MLQVVTGWPGGIGDEVITNPDIDIIALTGGAPVGKMVAARAGCERATLELGSPLRACRKAATALQRWRAA